MLTKNLFRRPRNKLEDVEGASVGHAPSVPDDLYESCPGCRAMLEAQELRANHYVCPRCARHLRVGARARVAMIADEGSFIERDAELVAGNPLDFPGYEEKLERARAASGEREGVVTGTMTIGGRRACVFSMEPNFMMGSMGVVVGEKIARLFEYATARDLPVIGFTVSGGARMQEGMLSLMQMAKTSGAIGRHDAKGLLYIVVLTDPTTGGVMASFAMEADIAIAEPGALVGFAGPRVIEQTIRQKLPEGFQRAEFLLEKGFIDTLCDRRQLAGLLSDLLSLNEGRAGR